MVAKVTEKLNCHNLFVISALGLFFFISLCGHSLTWAQEKGYPSQPIRIIVPNGPGGGNDLVARVVARYLAEELKVPVFIENRPGASGMLGASMVLKAKPDGYTLLAGGDSAMVTGILQAPNPPYNPFTDFLPICMLAGTVSALGVHSSSPIKTIMDFVRAAKENPGKLSCGFPTLGSSNHLTSVLFKRYAGVDINLVPYRGTSDIVTALLGKHLDMAILTYSAFRPYAQSGDARILALADSIPGTSHRTLMEEGFPQPEFRAVNSFIAYSVSANTPKSIYDKLVLSFERLGKNPEFAVKVDNVGQTPNYKNPAGCKEYTKQKWLVTSKILEELGLKKWQGKID